jgi:CheY-like chemotaxis protein
VHPAPSLPSPGPRRKLLLIDDDQAITEVLRLTLGARYDVVVLHQPEQALDVVRQERPDLVLCDIEMPGVDGYGVSHTLAGSPDTASVALMFLTGAYSAGELTARGDRLHGRAGQSKLASIGDILRRVDAEIALSGNLGARREATGLVAFRTPG